MPIILVVVFMTSRDFIQILLDVLIYARVLIYAPESKTQVCLVMLLFCFLVNAEDFHPEEEII